jgi:hypothetical protein
MAQAGGTDPAKLPEALGSVRSWVEQRLQQAPFVLSRQPEGSPDSACLRLVPRGIPAAGEPHQKREAS